MLVCELGLLVAPGTQALKCDNEDLVRNRVQSQTDVLASRDPCLATD
jgi:hypothetical protein